MKPTHSLERWMSYTVVLVLAVGSVCCGGGGGGGGSTGPLVAAFNPTSPGTPAANTINMSGAASGASFQVQVHVTGINSLYGAAFHVTFNSASATFAGFSSAGSVLGAGADIRAEQLAPGEVAAVATLQGQVQGTNVAGTQLLMTLNFNAIAETGNNPFTFGLAANRVVTTCPTPPAACSNIPDGSLVWTGGTLTASR